MMMVSSIQTVLEQVFIHLHAMTGDQKVPSPTSPTLLFPLFLLSLIYFQFSQKQAHTKIHTNALLQCTQIKPTLLLMFIHSVHSEPGLLPPRVTEGARRVSSPSGYPFLPITARTNCKFGICVPLLLNPLLPSLVKGSFGCSPSVKSK